MCTSQRDGLLAPLGTIHNTPVKFYAHNMSNVFNRRAAKRNIVTALRGKRKLNEVSIAPTQYKADPVQVRKLRFIATTAIDSDIAVSDIFNSYAFFASDAGSTTRYVAYKSLKLLRVQIWTQNITSDSSFSTCSIEWLGDHGKKTEFSASGNQMHPAYLSSAPPPETLAGFWFGASDSTVVCHLACGDGSIVDLELSYVPQSGTQTGTSVSSRTNSGFSYEPLIVGLDPVSNTPIT